MAAPDDKGVFELRSDGSVVLRCQLCDPEWIKVFQADRKLSPVDRALQSWRDHLERTHRAAEVAAHKGKEKL